MNKTLLIGMVNNSPLNKNLTDVIFKNLNANKIYKTTYLKQLEKGIKEFLKMDNILKNNFRILIYEKDEEFIMGSELNITELFNRAYHMYKKLSKNLLSDLIIEEINKKHVDIAIIEDLNDIEDIKYLKKLFGDELILIKLNMNEWINEELKNVITDFEINLLKDEAELAKDIEEIINKINQKINNKNILRLENKELKDETKIIINEYMEIFDLLLKEGQNEWEKLDENQKIKMLKYVLYYFLYRINIGFSYKEILKNFNCSDIETEVYDLIEIEEIYKFLKNFVDINYQMIEKEINSFINTNNEMIKNIKNCFLIFYILYKIFAEKDTNFTKILERDKILKLLINYSLY